MSISLNQINRGGAGAVRSVDLDLERFVEAGFHNLTAACRLKFWPKRTGVGHGPLLDLWPADGFFVDRVRGLQENLGFPVTGRVDEATWAAFQRHGALAAAGIPGSPADALIGNVFSVVEDKNSLAVRFCGESKARKGAWLVPVAERAKAMAENAQAKARPLNLGNTRLKVYTLGAAERQGQGTQYYAITFDQVLRSALWNQYVAGLAPGTQTAYVTRKEERLGIKMRHGIPAAYHLGSAALVTLIAQWEVTKGWRPVGMLTAQIAAGIQNEIKADTDWGRRLGALLTIPGVVVRPVGPPPPRTVDTGAQQRTLTATQANRTQDRRLGTQVQRDQYDRLSSATTSSRGLVAARETRIGRDAEIAARTAIVPSGGREPFPTNRFQDPRFGPIGGKLVQTLDPNRGAGTRQAAPANDTEPVVPAPPAPAVPASSDPAPWSAGDGAWSSASAEEIAAAQRDDEDSWGFDENGQPILDPPGEVHDGGPITVEPPAEEPKKSKKGLLFLAGGLVGAYFLLREG